MAAAEYGFLVCGLIAASRRSFHAAILLAVISISGVSGPKNAANDSRYALSWTEDEARAALVARQLQATPPPETKPQPVMTFSEARTRFLERKSRKKTLANVPSYFRSCLPFTMSV
jgi:hypothetical protein